MHLQQLDTSQCSIVMCECCPLVLLAFIIRTIFQHSNVGKLRVEDKNPILNSSLQLCHNLTNIWKLKSGLKLNALKSKCMLIHSQWKKFDGNLELFADGLLIEHV